MQLVANWREVLRYAWSIRLMVLAAILSGLEVALPFLEGLLPIPKGVFASLAALTTVAAFIARFLAQRSVSEEPDVDPYTEEFGDEP